MKEGAGRKAAPHAGPRRRRRRGAALEEAILQSAVEELKAVGYAGLTMEGIARRAGTNKNAIYRRWPGRAAIGVAAYRRMSEADFHPPDTGNLRGDVLGMLRMANRQLSSPRGAVLRGILAAAGTDPELQAMIREMSSDAGSADWLEILRRAVARGEARSEALHPRVVTVAIVLLRNEFVTRGTTTVPDRVLVEITDRVYLPLVRKP